MSFRSALDKLLGPLGFVREKSEWTRRTDGFIDRIYLHTGSIGTLVDYQTVDLTSQAIVAAAVPDWSSVQTSYIRLRVGPLKQHFRIDEDKPRGLSEAIRTIVLPFFEEMHTLEGQMRLYASSPVIGNSGWPLFVGLAHWRSGDIETADTVLRWSRQHVPKGVAGIKALRVHLGLSEDAPLAP